MFGTDVLSYATTCDCYAWDSRDNGVHNWADARGIHSICCPRGGFRIAWHDATCRETRDSIRAGGGIADLEPRYDASGERIAPSRRRGDVFSPNCPVEHNRPIATDHMVVNPLSDAHSRRITPANPHDAVDFGAAKKIREFPARLR